MDCVIRDGDLMSNASMSYVHGASARQSVSLSLHPLYVREGRGRTEAGDATAFLENVAASIEKRLCGARARGAVMNVSRRAAVICAKKPLSLPLRTHSPLLCHPLRPYLTRHLFQLLLPSWFFPSYGMGHWRSFSPLKSVMVRKRTVWTAEHNLASGFHV